MRREHEGGRGRRVRGRMRGESAGCHTVASHRMPSHGYRRKASSTHHIALCRVELLGLIFSVCSLDEAPARCVVEHVRRYALQYAVVLAELRGQWTAVLASRRPLVRIELFVNFVKAYRNRQVDAQQLLLRLGLEWRCHGGIEDGSLALSGWCHARQSQRNTRICDTTASQFAGCALTTLGRIPRRAL